MSDDEESTKPRRTLNLKSVNETIAREIKKITAVFKQEHNELKNEILTAIGDIIEDKLSVFDRRISNLETLVDKNELLLKELRSDIDTLTHNSNVQKSEIETLNSKLSELNNQVVERDESIEELTSYKQLFSSNVKALEERVENRTNRQLRKTLVISGIPEEANESWSATRRILAQTISENLPKCSYRDAADMFERVHRSGPTKNTNKQGRRDIFAALHEWDDAEYLTQNFRKLNSKNRNLKIYINYKYGPLTSRRRDAALKKRKELLKTKTVLKAYTSGQI